MGILAAHKVCTATAKLAKKNLKDIKVHWLRLRHQLNVALVVFVVVKVKKKIVIVIWHLLKLTVIVANVVVLKDIAYVQVK